jgi:Glycosyltransferase sugar-binding region containing DXD motif
LDQTNDIEFSDDFDNVTGADKYIVPNIIHFIRFKTFELNFIDYVVLKAAMRNHKPDKFFIHTNIQDVKYEGKYWDLVRKDRDLWSRIEVLYLEAPTEIFGQKLNEGWRFYHGGDIGRIRVLMQYGGIYLDNDCFVIHSLDKYRKFECAINWDENQFIGSQTIIAHKNARFLALWLDSYRNYRSEKWYNHYSFVLRKSY